MTWIPVGGADKPHSTAGTVPEPGQLIAVLARREAWRVVDVYDVHVGNWTDQARTMWEKAGSPPWETWPGREVRISVEPPHDVPPNYKRRGFRLSLWWSGQQWRPLNDPYPVCVACGKLWPCPCDDQNRETAAAMAEAGRLWQILPGCCWACHEPIAGRQRSITFEGENLLLPGAGPAVFHTSHSWKPKRFGSHKGTCREQAEQYECRWVLAGDGRQVRLVCPGIQFRHYQYVECTEGTACPGGVAVHARWTHCTHAIAEGWWTSIPGEEFRPDECRAPTNCGEKGCRGITAADITATDNEEAS